MTHKTAAEDFKMAFYWTNSILLLLLSMPMFLTMGLFMIVDLAHMAAVVIVALNCLLSIQYLHKSAQIKRARDMCRLTREDPNHNVREYKLPGRVFNILFLYVSYKIEYQWLFAVYAMHTVIIEYMRYKIPRMVDVLILLPKKY